MDGFKIKKYFCVYLRKCNIDFCSFLINVSGGNQAKFIFPRVFHRFVFY